MVQYMQAYLVFASKAYDPCCAVLCISVHWEQRDTITENYQANKFVLDPNEGFGRNKRSKPLKSKEEREAEDGETFSDDDGEEGVRY